MLFVLLLLVCVSALTQEEIVQIINSSPSTWRARINKGPFPVNPINASFEQRNHNSTLLNPFLAVPQTILTSLPQSFDARQTWPECVHSVMNQGGCNSCWAFASTGTLSDRFCIYSNVTSPMLSPQYILSCNSFFKCAMGELPYHAWLTLTNKGIPTDSCVPYVSGTGDCPKCMDKCVNGTSFEFFRATNFTHVGSHVFPDRYISSLMEEVTRGPVDATFMVYEDFHSYSDGVYEHKVGLPTGLHSVKVIGYGTENGTDYWLVQNSWGEGWGLLDGFFKIRRGNNECSFERDFYTGMPDLSVFKRETIR